MKKDKGVIKTALYPFFEYYNDGFTLKIDEKVVPARTHFWAEMCEDAKNITIEMTEEERLKVEKIVGQPVKQIGRTIVPKKLLKALFPENINNQKFWKTLDEKYKLLAVCGIPSKDESSANITNNSFAFQQGAIPAVMEKISYCLNTQDKVKIMEIGYGFGAFADWLHINCHNYIVADRIEYYGIDIDKRIDTYPNLYETDGWKIPKEVPKDLDIVYSMNVFQHLSQKQRFNYLKKAYNRLKDDGIMVFSSFIMTEENNNSWMWGLMDDKGRGYCHFFNQPTEVDRDKELKEELQKIGFEIETFEVEQINHLFCKVKKKSNVLNEEKYDSKNNI